MAAITRLGGGECGSPVPACITRNKMGQNTVRAVAMSTAQRTAVTCLLVFIRGGGVLRRTADWAVGAERLYCTVVLPSDARRSAVIAINPIEEHDPALSGVGLKKE